MTKEVNGKWWIPGEDKSASGVLKIEADGRAELKIIGRLRARNAFTRKHVEGDITYEVNTPESDELSGQYNMIYGSGDVGRVTLIDCYMKRSSGHFFGDHHVETIHVNQAYQGLHFPPGEAPKASAVLAYPRHLGHWSRDSGLSAELKRPHSGNFSDIDGPSITCFGELLADEEIEIGNGRKITLFRTIARTGDLITESGIKQRFGFKYSSDSLDTVEQGLSHLGAIQDLISIGIGGVAAFEEVTLHHPDKSHTSKETGRVAYFPVTMSAQWSPSTRSSGPPPRQLLFSFSDIGKMHGIKRWLELCDTHGTALARVMGTRYAHAMPAHDAYINLAASIESFDRDKFGDRISLKQRLSRSANFAGAPFMRLVGDRKKWARLATEYRNEIAHHYGRIHSFSNYDFMTESLYWLFVLCMLKEGGIHRAAFTEIMRENENYRWLSDNISRRVAAA